MGTSSSGANQCPAYDCNAASSAACTGSQTANGACQLAESPQHPVTLSPYALDRFEVTVGRFRTFVQSWDYLPPPEGAGGDPAVAGAGWRSAWATSLPSSRSELEASFATCARDGVSTWTTATGPNETLPINCVDWYLAFAFCAWDAGRLPTEAEWEFAAANGPAATLYPWGQGEPTSELASFGCAYGFDGGRACSLADVKPVGSFPGGVNQWGHHDLAGNVFEWTLDAFAPYATATDDAALGNYADVTDGFRVLRGGCFSCLMADLRATARTASPPGQPLTPRQAENGVGFRCARTP
jgi:formylglycine-generating enzyme required for sulfatase activity